MKPKENRPHINKFRNRRNLNILFLILFELFFLVLTVVVILEGEIYWTALILFIVCLHVISSSIYKIALYQKLQKLQKKPEEGQTDIAREKALQKKLFKGLRIIKYIFFVFYLAFLAYLISLFDF